MVEALVEKHFLQIFRRIYVSWVSFLTFSFEPLFVQVDPIPSPILQNDDPFLACRVYLYISVRYFSSVLVPAYISAGFF